MGWEGTKLLTNGEHDSLWRDAFRTYIPRISNSLRRANAIECFRELHKLGMYSDEVYAEGLSEILTNELFERPTHEEILKKLNNAEEES